MQLLRDNQQLGLGGKQPVCGRSKVAAAGLRAPTPCAHLRRQERCDRSKYHEETSHGGAGHTPVPQTLSQVAAFLRSRLWQPPGAAFMLRTAS